MIKPVPNGWHLKIKLTPRASQNKILGEEGGVLRISLNAPPVDGLANKALIVFLSDILGISKSKITLLRGQKSREKTVIIETEMSDTQLRALLSGYLEA